MSEVWTWGTVGERAPGDLAGFIRLCNTRFSRLSKALRGKQSSLGWFNVVDYGATGGGVVDDSPAIQRAVNAAEVQGGVVFFPVPGVYAMGSTVTVSSLYPVHLASAMQAQGGIPINGTHSYCKPIATLANGMFKYVTPTANRYEAGGGNIHGLSFFDAANRSYDVLAALNLVDWDDSILSSCHFHYLKGSGVVTDRAIMSKITDSWFRYCGDTSKSMLILGGNGGGGTNVTQAFTVQNSQFEVGYSAPYITLNGTPTTTQNYRIKLDTLGFESDTGIAATQQVYVYGDTSYASIDNVHFNRNTAKHLHITTNSIGWRLGLIESDSNNGSAERIHIEGQSCVGGEIYCRGGSSETGTAVRIAGSYNALDNLTCQRGGNVVVSGSDCSLGTVTLVDLDTTETHGMVLSGARGAVTSLDVYSPNDAGAEPLSLGTGCVALSVRTFDIAASGTSMASGGVVSSGEEYAFQRMPGAGAGGIALYDGATTPARVGRWIQSLWQLTNRTDAEAVIRITPGSAADQIGRLILTDRADSAKWDVRKTAANDFAIVDLGNSSFRFDAVAGANGTTSVNASGSGQVKMAVNSTGGVGFYDGLGASVASVSSGGDYDGAGGFAHSADGWYQDNVVASQTNVELTRGDGRFRAVRAGSVLGVIVHATEARTAGTLTVTVFKNTGLAGAAGASIGLTAVLDGTNTSRKATTQAKDTDTFAAGDEIYAVVTTDAGWLPVTSDIRVSILVEC